MIAEVKSTPDFRKKENRRKPEITFSFNPLQKKYSQDLTVLIIRAILHIEQRKREKRKVPEFRKQHLDLPKVLK